MSKPLALVVDDEPDICELLSLTLGRMDIDTVTAADVTSAKSNLEARNFDLCLTDMRLPDGDGLQLVEWMQSHASGVPVAVIYSPRQCRNSGSGTQAGRIRFRFQTAGHK